MKRPGANGGVVSENGSRSGRVRPPARGITVPPSTACGVSKAGNDRGLVGNANCPNGPAVFVACSSRNAWRASIGAEFFSLGRAGSYRSEYGHQGACPYARSCLRLQARRRWPRHAGDPGLSRCELSLGCPSGPGRGSRSCEASAILGRTG
jgi:hypothetical protein